MKLKQWLTSHWPILSLFTGVVMMTFSAVVGGALWA